MASSRRFTLINEYIENYLINLQVIDNSAFIAIYGPIYSIEDVTST